MQGSAPATEELLRRYKGYSAYLARQAPIPGVPFEDAAQEALIAIHEAIRQYNPHFGIPFAPFAKKAAQMRLYNVRRDQARLKRVTLDRAQSFDARPSGDDSGATLSDTLAAEGDAFQTALARADMRAALPLAREAGDLDTVLAIIDRHGIDVVVEKYYLEPRARREHHLSRTETKIALAYIDQVPPAEIARELRLTVKQVDNGRRRFMQKLAMLLRHQD